MIKSVTSYELEQASEFSDPTAFNIKKLATLCSRANDEISLLDVALEGQAKMSLVLGLWSLASTLILIVVIVI